MKNIQILFISLISLFLFACDSSSSNPTPAGDTFKINVAANGITNGQLQIYLSGSDQILKFTSGNETFEFTKAIASGNEYTVGVLKDKDGNNGTGQTCTFDSNGAETLTVNSITANVTEKITCGAGGGKVSLGKSYYESKCAICHATGTADKTAAFASRSTMDLADNFQNRETNNADVTKTPIPEKIKPDMHAIGNVANLMGNFDAEPAASVDNLKAYLRTVPLK